MFSWNHHLVYQAISYLTPRWGPSRFNSNCIPLENANRCKVENGVKEKQNNIYYFILIRTPWWPWNSNGSTQSKQVWKLILQEQEVAKENCYSNTKYSSGTENGFCSSVILFVKNKNQIQKFNLIWIFVKILSS